MFKITKPGEYRTREERKVIVLTVDAKINNDFKVLGYLENGDNADTWASAGNYLADGTVHSIDIVSEWREPVVSSETSKFLQYVRELEELKDVTEDLVHSIDIDSIDRIEDVLKRLRDVK